MQKNKLEVILDNSCLDRTRSQYILDNFTEYFELAAKWEKIASEIIVTDESQKDIMEKARSGRLMLKEKRIIIEKERKKLKEPSLQEGKTIDGIANVLKGLIEPIERHLDQQEHYVENKRKAEEALIAEKVKKEMEEKRLEEERKEQERIKQIEIENMKLKQDAIEKKMQYEKKNQSIIEKAKEYKKKVDDENKKKIEKIKENIKKNNKCPKCGYEF